MQSETAQPGTQAGGRETPPPKRPERMTARERILAALRRQPVDRLPFTPLIDHYVLLDLYPEIWREKDRLKRAWITLKASRAFEIDVLLRHVPVIKTIGVNSVFIEQLGQFGGPCQVRSVLKNDLLIETLDTPVGSLSGTWGFTEESGILPHPVKHLVNNYEELKIYHYAVEHMRPKQVVPDYETFLAVDKAIGRDGIATTSFHNTPLMHLIECVWGLENTIYLLNDHRAEVEDILEKLYHPQKQFVEQLAASPAQIAINYENTSSTLISPKYFRRYCLPHLNEYAQILHSAGKINLVHMCGKLRAFVDDFREGLEADGIADIAPAPTGDLPLYEAAANLGGKVVVGGIDATTFINPAPEGVEAKVSDLIARLKPYRGVLLGSGDATPRGAPVENFHLIRRLVDVL